MEYTKNENKAWKVTHKSSIAMDSIWIENEEGHGIAVVSDEGGNAHLIAAAPNMEAVLRQFVRYCKQWQENNGEFPKGDGRSLILKNARLALAKTEGVK